MQIDPRTPTTRTHPSSSPATSGSTPSPTPARQEQSTFVAKVRAPGARTACTHTPRPDPARHPGRRVGSGPRRREGGGPCRPDAVLPAGAKTLARRRSPTPSWSTSPCWTRATTRPPAPPGSSTSVTGSSGLTATPRESPEDQGDHHASMDRPGPPRRHAAGRQPHVTARHTAACRAEGVNTAGDRRAPVHRTSGFVSIEVTGRRFALFVSAQFASSCRPSWEAESGSAEKTSIWRPRSERSMPLENVRSVTDDRVVDALDAGAVLAYIV